MERVACNAINAISTECFTSIIPTFDLPNFSNAIVESAQRISQRSEIMAGSLTNIVSTLDMQKLSSAIVESAKEISQEAETPIVSLASSIADHYEVASQQEKETISKIQDASRKEKMSLEEKNYIIALLSIVLVICQTLLSTYSTFIIKTAPQNETNIVQYVNNYYVDCGNLPDFLNNYGMRIINRETLARRKPDCSSKVEGELKKGTVVTITDKYKKWFQITWVDENGNSRIGWIQNYKMSLFKNY